MADLNDESLKKLLGDDPIATSVSVRIRQDEQTLNNLERKFNSIKKEAEGIAKALREAGVQAGKLGAIGGRGGKSMSTIGSTNVAGGIITPTPIDRGQGTVTSMSPTGQSMSSGGGGGNAFTRMFRATQPAPDGSQTVGSVRMATGAETLNTVLASADARINRGYQYSLSADRMNMLFQQMKGMSQQAVQDTYRQPLTKYMLGQGGINTMMALEATTGISAAQQARSVESLRISSGFSVNAQQAASTLEQLASPQVANRMFMMTGMSIVKPGGGYRSMDELMQNIVRTQGLTDPNILRGAKAPGSVTRANLNQIGVTGELQNQILQYAEQNLAYKQKGGTGMYDPASKEHQKLMGIDKNFAMEKEKTTRLEIEREEKFYSRQADNFADLEQQTQSLVRMFTALEDKLSGLFGLRISTQTSTNFFSALGNKLMPGGFGDVLGKGLGLITGITQMGDAPGFVTADQAERMSSKKGTPSTAATLTAQRKSITTSGMGSGKAPVYGPPAPKPSIWKNTSPNKPSSIWGINAAATSAPGVTTAAGSTSGMFGGMVQQGQLTVYEMKLKNTPIVGPDGKVTNLYDLYKNPKVQGQFPGFTAGWMDLYADYYAQTGDIGRLNAANRTFAEQEALWHSRMKPTGRGKGDMPADSRGDWFYQGQYWVKKDPSMADAAWPGAPWANHQHGLAIDLSVSNKDEWAKFNRANADKYGIEWFGDVNNEPWHLQMAGTRVRGEGGGAGFVERQGFSVPTIGPNEPADAMEGRFGQVVSFSANRGQFIRGGSPSSNPAGSLGNRRQRAYSADASEGNKLMRDQLSRGATTMQSKGVAGMTLSSGAYVSGKFISAEELMQTAYNAGFRGDDLVIAYAIAMRESAGDVNALNDKNELSLGLWQHNMDPKTTSAAGNRKAWGLTSNEELYDPTKNAYVAFEKYKWNQAHGRDPFHDWGPYKGMSPLGGGAASHLNKGIAVAKSLGYITNYTGRTGDAPGPTSKQPAYRPELRALPSLPDVNGYQSMGTNAGGGSPTVVGGASITISPTININASAGSLDQDLEKMARRVATMLEREVNRTMMRRN